MPESPIGTVRVRCPHCLRQTHARWWLPSDRYKFSRSSEQPRWAKVRFGEAWPPFDGSLTYQCDTTFCPENGCRAPITIALLWNADSADLKRELETGWHITPGDTHLVELLEVLPSSGIGRDLYRNLPEKIQQEFPALVDLAEEGRAPATAAAGCGSCLEEALKALEKRALDENWIATQVKPNARLIDRIDALVTAGVVTKDIGEWSHQVRVLRNDGTHQLAGTVDEVRELVAFMKFFFEATFLLPARLKALKVANAPPQAKP